MSLTSLQTFYCFVKTIFQSLIPSTLKVDCLKEPGISTLLPWLLPWFPRTNQRDFNMKICFTNACFLIFSYCKSFRPGERGIDSLNSQNNMRSTPERKDAAGGFVWTQPAAGEADEPGEEGKAGGPAVLPRREPRTICIGPRRASCERAAAVAAGVPRRS